MCPKPTCFLFAALSLTLLVACNAEQDRMGPATATAAAATSNAATKAPPPADPGWTAAVAADIAALDEAMPGELGVYLRRYGDQAGELDAGGDRAWYLSSTIKVPVAIAVLEKVDAGDLALAQEVELKATDFVDGAGDMLQQQAGKRFAIATLLEKSLRDSDSTATDMLIRVVGQAELNRRIKAWVGEGFGEITTILQVRYDAYGALHPDVARLTNAELLAIRSAGAGEERLQALAKAISVPRGALPAKDLSEVFEDYYGTGKNSARLDAFGRLLGRLASGELLSPVSTSLLLDHMRAITTGSRRLSAGLPPGTDFAQKTGTQIARACNVGILEPNRGTEGATLVVACAEGFEQLPQAERAFEGLGRAIGDAGLAR